MQESNYECRFGFSAKQQPTDTTLDLPQVIKSNSFILDGESGTRALITIICVLSGL